MRAAPRARSPRRAERRRRHSRRRARYRRRRAGRSRRYSATVRGAWPGTIHAGPRTLRPSIVTSTMSPFDSPYASAVAGLMPTTLSHVILVSGFGSSCSHAILAKRPSQMRRIGLEHDLRMIAVSVASLWWRRELWLTMAAAARRCRRQSRHAARAPSGASKSAPNASRQVARTAASGAGSTGPKQQVDELMHAARCIERRDHRLDDGCAAVDCASIAPAFQRMRKRQVPLAQLRGFVCMQARMDPVRHMSQPVGEFQRVRGWRRPDCSRP